MEVYSKTKLTNPTDKLIALSGIAKMLSTEIDDRYVAGMWVKNLASHLLWRVDPVWEKNRFHYLSVRPGYRAPSFSWAAIDAERGIKYGEIIDEDDEPLRNNLYIDVKNMVVIPEDPENEFGLIREGRLTLYGVFQKIEMNEEEQDDSHRYKWHLVGMSGEGDLKLITFRNVYLDSPSSDTNIFGPEGHLYCVPAMKDSKKYLICLLLQLERKDGRDTGSFRRVGITKIPPYDE